jgi:hypothetical protein
MKRVLLVLGLLAVAGLFALPFLGKGDPADGQEKKPMTGFAEDRVPPMLPRGDEKPVAFDGKRAMRYLRDICAIGPRMSGTLGMKKQQDLVKKHFDDLGVAVEFQKFQGKQPSQARAVEMANVIVSFHPDFPRRIILCSHYDTRPIADQEPDPRKWRDPFVSANDGGSGVAFLMEMAHHVKGLKTKVGVDFVLFDGEEYIFDKNRDKYFLGSQHFAQAWRIKKDRPEYLGAVLLDMIAGKNARFPVEGYSWFRAERLCRDLWGIAQEQDCRAFVPQLGDHVQDDHLALLNADIPAVDIIDFSYRHWHRLTDTPENCDPAGMEQVAKVLSVWLQRVK